MKTMQSAVWGRGPLPGLLAGLVVGLLAMGRGAAAALLEQNPWDNLTRPGWIYDSGSHVIDSTSGTPNGTNALRFTFPAGFMDGNGPGIAEYGLSPRNEIYYGYWFKLSPNFQMHPVMQKLSFFWHNATELVHDGVSGGGISCVAGDCSAFKVFFHEGGPAHDRLRGQNQTYNPTLQTNRWYWLEVRLVMNTPGSSNGIVQIWLDDQLIMSYTDTFYRFSGQTSGWETFMHSATYGGNGVAVKTQTDYLWFDQTTLATTRIGMPGNPPPVDTTAPSTPTGLTATAVSASQINLAWTASTDPESGVASYNLYRCSGSSTCTPSLLTNVGNVTAYANTSLTGTTIYRYQVSAVNGAGLEGGKSTIQTTATPIAPAFDFALSHGGNRSVPQGSSVTNSITATLVPGASAQSVAFSVSSTLPSGTTASFSPTSCLPDCLSTLTLTTSGTTPTGTWGVTVTGTGGGLTRTTSFTLTVTVPLIGGGIAARYPGDVGIETDPQVVFVERFDDALANLASRWTEIKDNGSLSLTADRPSGSLGGTSLRIAGGIEGGHLYKNLAAAGVAQNDLLYLRYYVKYPVANQASHDGIWMGGYHPPLDYPFPQAGVRPTGNDRFHAAAEDLDADGYTVDHYDYWMGMHPDGLGSYWGNVLLNDPNVKTKLGQWMCLEHMVKLNNPVTALNGEHAIWLDGVKVSHLGQGFPRGYWIGGRFFQDPSVATTFEGFQWRNDPNLNLNYLWLQNWTPTTPTELEFDHVVAATSYIGCLASGSSTVRGDLDGNGKVDLDDLRRMIYMLIGIVPPDLTTADLDGDGQLLLVDLQALVRILVGLP